MGTSTAENEVLISPPPPWIELPGDVTANILQRLGAKEILESAEKVCTTWKNVCLDPAMWRVVDLRQRKRCGDQSICYFLCFCAVDRSQGQLADLRICCYRGAYILNFVAYRCSNLRRLTLTDARFDVSDVVEKFPLLEELHLFMKQPLDEKDVEAIGISYPLLKSFTYDECLADFSGSEYEDEERSHRIAFAVAKTMTNLHRLRLDGVMMVDEGLEAIFDGCPHLELLDLPHCHVLRDDLLKSCSNKIKDLRLPTRPSRDDLESNDRGFESYDVEFNSLCYRDFHGEYDE